MDKITELAKLMSVSENSLIEFLKCLNVWTEKGYTVEQAIIKNEQYWNTVATGGKEFNKLKMLCADLFYN